MRVFAYDVLAALGVDTGDVEKAVLVDVVRQDVVVVGALQRQALLPMLFLLEVGQLEEVLRRHSLHPVPFSRHYFFVDPKLTSLPL